MPFPGRRCCLSDFSCSWAERPDRIHQDNHLVNESTSARRSAAWPAYAAAAWAFAFAVVSFYWTAGGEFGIGTLARGIQEKARERDTGMLILTLATGILKVIGGLVALALVRPWGRRIPRRLLLVLAFAGGGFILLYEGASFIEAALMQTGVIGTPESMGATAVTWSLLFWRPFWLLGGALFVLAAWWFMRSSHQPPER